MSENLRNVTYFEVAIAALSNLSPITRESISVLRQEMDRACDQKEISLKEWRRLLDAVAQIQSTIRPG